MVISQDNIAYYLKYRPQTLDELIGQDSIKRTLLSAHKSKKLAHAYLLVGPRGTGKTSTARILAKMVNCESQGEQNSRLSTLATSHYPCNQCSTCISITDGSNLDLIEIDAASNRGIEDIRSLRERIKLVPTNAKKKVYIVDEVHMLTTEAFNALLKTLEEPPAHALFILATTDVSKVPQTIISRAQRLDFKLASPQEICQALERIAREEKIDIDEEALKLLSKKADGSFRDGVKLLDQVVSLGGKITAATLLTVFSSSQFDDLIDFLKDLADHQTDSCLVNLNKQIEKGTDVKQLILSLMDLLRSLMLVKNGVGDQLVKDHWTEDKYERLVELSEKFNYDGLIIGLESFQEAFEKLKFASIPSLPLELAVIEICGEQASKTVEDRELKMVVEDRKSQIENEEIHTPSSIVKDPPSTIHLPLSKQDDATPSGDILKLKEKWTFVLETIRPYNFSLEALLRSVNITECSQTTMIMEVPYSFHQRILEAPKNRDLLESIISDILGRQIRISTVLGNRPQRKEDIANVEVAADDEIIRVAAEIFNSDSVN